MLSGAVDWVWVERLGWLAQIASVPLVLWGIQIARQQLGGIRRDQGAILEALRKPSFDVGFNAQFSKSMILAVPTDGSPVDVEVLVRNAGDATATHVLHNVTMPQELDTPPRRGIPIGPHVTYRRDSDGDLRAIFEEDHLVAGVATPIMLKLIFPPETVTHHLVVHVVCAEIPETVVDLQITASPSATAGMEPPL
jgi:hypothetical protein